MNALVTHFGEHAERFWAKVERRGPEDCWPWQAFRNPLGYGMVRFDGRSMLAHRVSWMLTHGDPGALCVLHRCDNPPCVNPEHLWLGTRADNTADMCAKQRDRHPAGEAHGRAQLTRATVDQIRAAFRSGKRQVDIATELGIPKGRVYQIVRGRQWR